MKNFLNKQREILALVAYAIIVAGVFYFLVIPLISRIDGKSNQIQEDAINQESVSKHLSDLPKIEAQYQTLQKNGDAVDMLLDKNNAVVLIEKLEKLADDTGNKITISITPETPDQQKAQPASIKNKTNDTLVGNLPSTKYLQMKIVINGKYNSIANFIRLLENFEYYSDVIDMQIVKGDSSTPSQKTVYDAGMMSVVPGPGNGTGQAASAKSDDALEASLNTVFYTR